MPIIICSCECVYGPIGEELLISRVFITYCAAAILLTLGLR